MLLIYLLLCSSAVVVEVEEIAVVVVDVVVVEEGAVLRRGSLVLCPFRGEEYCCVDDPFGLDLHQHLPPLLLQPRRSMSLREHSRGVDVGQHAGTGSNINR
jgi:hypothetical protein